MIPPQRSRVEGNLIVNYVCNCNCSNVPTHFLSFCVLQFNQNYSRKTTTILRISVLVACPPALYCCVPNRFIVELRQCVFRQICTAVNVAFLTLLHCSLPTAAWRSAVKSPSLSVEFHIVAWPSGLCCRVLHWFIVESSCSITSQVENSHPNSDALAMRRSQTLHAQTLHRGATQPNIFEHQPV